MKRVQRIHRVTRHYSPRPGILLPLALLGAACVMVVQLGCAGVLATAAASRALTYYRSITTQGLAKLRHARTLAAVQYTRILDRNGRLLWEISAAPPRPAPERAALPHPARDARGHHRHRG